MAVDLSRPSVVPGCPPLQLKPSHFPVFQIPISLKNPSQSEVVRNWLSCPGAEAGCPSVRGARPLLPAQRPHTVGCLSSGHSRLLPWASFGFSTWYQPSLTPCPPPPAHAFCLPLAAKSKNSPGLRGYFPLPLPHPCSKLALPPPILQDCHSPPASVSTKPRGGFCVLLLLHETFQPHTTDGLLSPERALPGRHQQLVLRVSSFLSGFPLSGPQGPGFLAEALFSSLYTLCRVQNRLGTNHSQICTSKLGFSPELPEPSTHLFCRHLSILPQDLQTEYFLPSSASKYLLNFQLFSHSVVSHRL